MVDIAQLALDFIENYGLIAIFILLVLDGALLLPVFPGELVLIIAVTTYATGPEDLLFLIILTSAAALVGSLLLYAVCRGGGRKLVERFPGFFMMPRKRRERLERVFANPFGQTLVLFLRLFPLTRVLVNIPAGLAKMPLLRFVIMSTIGLVAYHAAFLWFTFEVRRPGSELESQTNQLKEAYASPAMDFVETNAIITGLIILVIGVALAIKASANMIKDPEESTGSLIGTLAIATLFWGGIALAIGTYLDPETVFTLIELGGLDTAFLGVNPVAALGVIAGTSIVVGALLRGLYNKGKRRRRVRRRARRIMAKREKDATIQAALSRGPEDPFRPVVYGESEKQFEWEPKKPEYAESFDDEDERE